MEQPAILLIKQIYFPILAAVSVPANLVTIVILSRGNCGLSKCISVYMVAMATADLLVLIINVIVYHIFNYHFPLSFLSYTPVCKFILYLSAAILDLSVWFTVSFTFDRFVVICCRKFKTKYCTERTATAVITTFSVLIILKDIPVLFAYETQQLINKVQWGCRTNVAFISSAPGVTYVWFHSVWRVWLPFTLIALLNYLTVRRIVLANRARRGLLAHTSENQSDPEMENRRKSIILLFAISGSFILLWLTAAVSLVTTRLTNINFYRADRTDPGYIATEAGTMLKFWSCFQNLCIYAATQRKFREEVKNVVKSPCSKTESSLALLKIKPVETEVSFVYFRGYYAEGNGRFVRFGVEQRVESIRCIREAENYVDSTFQDVFTPQLNGVVERKWMTTRHSECARQRVEERGAAVQIQQEPDP
uniref:probable G-protein coupled receptor 139 n=1 Tax=Pristiophorus japonicus TaxID=55135 RepID=UPI00398E3464